MPDDRMLHKRLGRSEKVCGLSDFEFRVWVQYELSADDCGLMTFAAGPLQSENYYLADKPAKLVLRALDRLVQVGLLRIFEHQGRQYVCQLDWQDFQRVRYPRESHLPMPPSEVLAMMTTKTAELFLIRRNARSAPTPEDSGKVSEKDPAPARAGAIAKRLTANGERQTAETDFAGFWQRYPKKVAKEAALKAWRKISPDIGLQAQIFLAVEAQAQSPAWRKDNGQFVPHPATWLNGRRWEDEKPASPSSRPQRIAPDIQQLCDAAGLKRHDIEQWFAGAVLRKDGGRVVLQTADDDARGYIARHFADVLEAAVLARGGLSLALEAS